MRPRICTSACARRIGTVSAMEAPDVVTSSMMTTRSPSWSFAPSRIPVSPWSFTSLRLQQ